MVKKNNELTETIAAFKAVVESIPRGKGGIPCIRKESGTMACGCQKCISKQMAYLRFKRGFCMAA